MKHVFWVHSNITYLISNAIIKQNNINNAVYLLTRNFSIPYYTEVQQYKFPYYYTSYSSKHQLIKKFNIFQSLKSLDNCNKIINEIIEDSNFIFYTPLYNQPSIRCFIEHKSCESFYYIEEGTASYKQLSHFNKNKNKLKHLIKNIYFKLLPYSNIMGGNFFNNKHRKFKGCYSFFEDAFPWNNKEKNILELCTLTKIEKIRTDAFLFFDALVEYGLINEHVFLNVLKDVINHFIKSNIKSISFKFHPVQIEQSIFKNQIINLFSKYNDRISFEEIEDEFIAENYFLQHKSRVFVFLSSVGLYAKKSNSEVISLLPFFKKYDLKFYKKYCN